jgi:hypothetical protein
MHKVQMKNSSQHQADVEKHGDRAMGFPHDETTAIRSHLEHIVRLFSHADFSIPIFVHDQVPPGIPVMKEKRDQISYSLEEISGCARLSIQTRNGEAVKAVHDFLRFPIEDHHTGDATDVSVL